MLYIYQGNDIEKMSNILLQIYLKIRFRFFSGQIIKINNVWYQQINST